MLVGWIFLFSVRLLRSFQLLNCFLRATLSFRHWCTFTMVLHSTDVLFLVILAFVWTGVTALRIPFRSVLCVSRLVSIFFLVGILRRFGKLGYFIFAFFARFQVMMKLFSPSGAFLMRFFLRVSFIFVFFLFLLVAAARLLTRSTQLFSFTLCIGWYGIFVFGFPSYYVPCFCLCWSFFRYFFALLAPFWRNFKLCWFFYLN